jgi:hypothetical protein
VIKTTVNGQIKFSKQVDVSDSARNKREYIRNLLKAIIEKLLKIKDKYQEHCKHKVLIIGDSYVRGCATEMIASLDTRFDVYGVVIPGFDTGLLSVTMKKEVSNLTTHDFLVIISGTNDIVRND